MAENKTAGNKSTRESSNASRQNKARSRWTSAEDRADCFSVLAWLTDGAAGVASELKKRDLGLGDEFWAHTHNARREGLLAARALLDQVIERTEKRTPQGTARQ